MGVTCKYLALVFAHSCEVMATAVVAEQRYSVVKGHSEQKKIPLLHIQTAGTGRNETKIRKKLKLIMCELVVNLIEWTVAIGVQPR